MKANKTLQFKLFLILSVCMAAIVLLLTIVSMALITIRSNFGEMKVTVLDGNVAAISINRDINYISRLTRNIMLGSDLESDLSRLDERIVEIRHNFEILSNSAIDERETEQIQKAKDAALAFVEDGRRFAVTLRNLPKEERHTKYDEYGITATPLAQESRKYFGEIVNRKNDLYLTGIDSFDSSIKYTLWISIGIALILMVIVLSISLNTLKAILRSLRTAIAYTEEIAEGHYDAKVDFNAFEAEIALMVKALFAMTGNIKERQAQIQKKVDDLNTVLSKVTSATSVVTTSSSQVEQSSQSLSQSATEQAASLEEVTASMSEIGSQVKDNAANVLSASELASEMAKAASSGEVQMNKMAEAMSQIHQSSQQIEKVIKVIDDIAFQTNLLALNASVEAARAGQHGKGFSVVAEEVRKLAGRSAKAAKETGELIQISGTQVNNGARIAEQTTTSFKDIVSKVEQVAKLTEGISDASARQSAAISEVNKGFEQMNNATQVMASISEESAASADELLSQANILQQTLDQFTGHENQSPTQGLSNSSIDDVSMIEYHQE